MQRCRDLQEVCEGQTQFARKVGAEGGSSYSAELPVFGGGKAARSLDPVTSRQWQSGKGKLVDGTMSSVFR